MEEHTYNSTGATTSNNTYYYSFGDRLIAGKIGTVTEFYLTDALGSVNSTITKTANGAVVRGNQVYDPYDKQRYKQGSIDIAIGE